MGGRTFTPLVELLRYNCFPVDSCRLECMELYLTVIVPLLPSLVASSLALDVRYLFFFSEGSSMFVVVVGWWLFSSLL